MKSFKKYTVIASFVLAALSISGHARAQVFYIGVNGSAVYSWFDSPKFDNLVTSEGWGWDLGFFLRYGKRPYFQAGFDWVRSANDFTIGDPEEPLAAEKIKFHNFDFSLKVGYEILQTPMFKLKVHTGPFIGKSLMFSGETIEFLKDDFKNPQFGFIAGAGFQFTNLVVDFEYSYHFTDLFKPVAIDGETYELGSHLQLIALKVGFMF